MNGYRYGRLARSVFRLVFKTLVLVIALVDRRWTLLARMPLCPTARRLVAAIALGAALGGIVLASPGAAATVDTAVTSELAPTASDRPSTPGPPAPAVAERAAAHPASQSGPSRPAATDRVPLVTVVAGDTPWGLAEHHLGDGIRWRELWQLNRGVAQPDGRAWVTEDLIRPGWHLRLPADITTVSHDPPAPARPTRRPPRPRPTRPPSHPTTSPVDSAPPPLVTSTEQPDGAPELNTSHDGDSLPPFAGLAAAVGGCTGLALLIRHRRRRRTITTVPSRHEHTPAPTTATSDLPLIEWASRHLAALFDDLPRRHSGGPVAVELSPETGIELLWDTPNVVTPPPWRATDGGWAWHLTHAPNDPAPITGRPPGIPGLTTIGTRQGRQLLIDLEAFGSLSLDGDPQRAAELARAMTAELGATDGLTEAQVVVTDPDLLDEGSLPRGVKTSSTDSALERLRTAAAVAGAAPTAITVVVAPAERAATSLIDAAPPRRRVAAILLGTAPGAAARITVDHQGAAELQPLGIKFQASGLPPASTDNVAHLFDGARQPPQIETPDGAGLEVPADDDALDEPTRPEMLVKVLGHPHVPTRPNLRRRELALVVYLASKGKPTPASSVQHAVWGGRSVQTKTIWNLATTTRTALGHLADGRPAMPPSQRAHNTLALAPEVRTDLQVLEDLYNAAQDAPSSRAIELLARGLDLIEGQPFDSPDCEWAHHTELLVAQANRLIEDAAEQLVDLATTAGRIDLARHAITQGLRALPGNEVLYRARMTLEHDQNNLAAVHTAYTELETYLTDIDTQPSPATTTLYRRLRPQPQRRAS